MTNRRTNPVHSALICGTWSTLFTEMARLQKEVSFVDDKLKCIIFTMVYKM